MVSQAPAGNRLKPIDWARAALEAIAEGGISAVAVEGLAPKVGASKGSFYWHFQDRAALVQAALELWEEERTDAIIEQVGEIADPVERLRRLFTLAYGNPWGGRLETHLASQPWDAEAIEVLQRVTVRRLDFLTDALTEIGFASAAARHRALLTYSAYVGFSSVREGSPEQFPDEGEALDAYVASLLEILIRP